MLKSAQSCKKSCTFLDNLRIIIQEGNMETRQMIPCFSSNFPDLTVCNIHFWSWKYSKFILIWSRFWSILVCKIPQFLAKSYWFRQLITLFLERHPEVTKNLYYIFSTRQSQIRYLVFYQNNQTIFKISLIVPELEPKKWVLYRLLFFRLLLMDYMKS